MASPHRFKKRCHLAAFVSLRFRDRRYDIARHLSAQNLLFYRIHFSEEKTDKRLGCAFVVGWVFHVVTTVGQQEFGIAGIG